MVTDNQVNSHEETVVETIRGAVAGDDVPMEENHKTATAVLVAATYPVALILLLIVGLVIAYYTSRATNGDVSPPAPAVAR